MFTIDTHKRAGKGVGDFGIAVFRWSGYLKEKERVVGVTLADIRSVMG